MPTSSDLRDYTDLVRFGPGLHPLAAEIIPGANSSDDHASSARSAATVLIFDADPTHCASIGTLVNRRGHSVALACTSDMAISMLKTITFHLVICDYTTPLPETRRWLDSLIAEPPCPLILTTGESSLDLAVRAANLPLAGFYPKPVDRRSLGRLVDRLLRSAVP